MVQTLFYLKNKADPGKEKTCLCKFNVCITMITISPCCISHIKGSTNEVNKGWTNYHCKLKIQYQEPGRYFSKFPKDKNNKVLLERHTG
jgi:hypothetical protein